MKTDLVSTGYIIDENYGMLLVYHKKLKLWLPVGGHIEQNETPDQAMIREAREEVGLEIELLNKPKVSREGNIVEQCAVPFYTNVHSVGDHLHYSLFYVCRPKGEISIKLNREELVAATWFTKGGLKDSKIPIEVKNIGLLAYEIYERLK